jgi:predicted RNase H-like nuclease
MNEPVIGVDGCKAGWIAVLRETSGKPTVLIAASMAELVQRPGLIAIDMPIGLPARTTRGGRGPEIAVRPHLGQRQSSVFAMPSRAAVHAATYREACDRAFATSDPPRKISKQAFFLFPKVREIDALLLSEPSLRPRLRECHPEAAFMVMNGGKPLASPKKIKGRINPDGMEERRALLESVAGFDRAFLMQVPPRGAQADDFLDACAACHVAARLSAGVARCFPDPPERDALGLEIAIWA